jgi:hypothetical protein
MEVIIMAKTDEFLTKQEAEDMGYNFTGYSNSNLELIRKECSLYLLNYGYKTCIVKEKRARKYCLYIEPKYAKDTRIIQLNYKMRNNAERKIKAQLKYEQECKDLENERLELIERLKNETASS